MANKIGNWIESQRIESNRIDCEPEKYDQKLSFICGIAIQLSFQNIQIALAPAQMLMLHQAASSPCPLYPAISLFTQAEQQQAKLVCIISLALIYSKCNRNCSPKSSVSDYMKETAREGGRQAWSHTQIYLLCIWIVADMWFVRQ